MFRRQHERAVRLAAAAGQQRSSLGLVAFAPASERTDRQLAAASTALGDENFEKTFEEGTRLSLADAVAYAQRGRGERASATYGWASLSPVQRQVAELASQGLNNPDIARELFMSRNTVKAHLSHAYAKLGVANRTELARLAAGARRKAKGAEGAEESIPSWVMFRGLAVCQPRFQSRTTNRPAGLTMTGQEADESVAVGPHEDGSRRAVQLDTSRMVARDDLVDRLDRAAARKVTIISAPAGSGKTSLLRAWAGRPGRAHHVAYVPVRRDEQDAQLFWLSLLNAVRARLRHGQRYGTADGNTGLQPPHAGRPGALGARQSRTATSSWSSTTCTS